MNPRKLLAMAEQIAVNVTASRDVAVIADRTADHLERFWDPGMRQQLLAYVEESGPEVSDAVREAVRRLRHRG